MRDHSEHRSPHSALILCVVLASCLAPVARAQAPSCSWGDGVAISGAEGRTLMLAGDGGAGLLAVSVSVTGEDPGTLSPHVGSLRLHHVLEQGRLDPAFPAGGVTFFTPPPLAGPDDHPRTSLARVLADGTGGVWVLAIGCNPDLAKLRCWEVQIARLFHVTGSGALALGFPADGISIPVWPTLEPRQSADMTSDGAGGVIVAWIDLTSGTPDRAVLAQRFLGDGTPAWAGGLSGQVMIAPTNVWRLCLAGDPAGGAVVVATRLVTAVPTYQFGLLASRVAADASLPWGTLGVPVLDLGSTSEVAQDASMDELGNTFVTVGLTQVSSGARSLGAQLLLHANGQRGWGPFGIQLGGMSDSPVSALARQGAYTSMYRDPTGAVRYQAVDEFGTGYWGDLGDGVDATWSNPAPPLPPLRLPDGHLLSVWSTYAPYPAVSALAMELDEMGAPVAGWPDNGAVVCGGQEGHVLADAILLQGALFVALGGSEFSSVTPRVQRMSRAVLGVGPTLPAHALELAPPAPNPSRREWTLRFALREAADVTLELFDIAGRRVLREELGGLGPGPHLASVGHDAAIAPGVYRVRVRAGTAVAERMLVRSR